MTEETPAEDVRRPETREEMRQRRSRLGGLARAARSISQEQKSEEMRKVANARWERVRVERAAAGALEAVPSKRPAAVSLSVEERLMLSPYIEDVQRAHPEWAVEAIERQAVAEMRLYTARLEGGK